MIDFPAICPTKRSYVPAGFATKRYTAINGAGVTRLYGTKSFDAELSLQFVVKADQLLEIQQCWDRSRGTFEEVRLPYELIAPTEAMADALIPEQLEWHWSDVPKFETVTPDLFRVTANFIAQLEITS